MSGQPARGLTRSNTWRKRNTAHGQKRTPAWSAPPLVPPEHAMGERLATGEEPRRDVVMGSAPQEFGDGHRAHARRPIVGSVGKVPASDVRLAAGHDNLTCTTETVPHGLAGPTAAVGDAHAAGFLACWLRTRHSPHGWLSHYHGEWAHEWGQVTRAARLSPSPRASAASSARRHPLFPRGRLGVRSARSVLGFDSQAPHGSGRSGRRSR